LGSAAYYIAKLGIRDFDVAARVGAFQKKRDKMTHESKDCSFSPMYGETRTVARVSCIAAVAADKPFQVGFYSLERDDPEESVMRATLDETGDFAWRRLERRGGVQGLLPSASDVAALRPGAVIAVLSTAKSDVIEPLFAQFRLDDPQRPILVAPRGLSADGISEVLSGGASDFLLPPYRAENLVPRLRRLLHQAPRRNQVASRIQVGVGLRSIIGQSPALLGEVQKLTRFAACDAPVLIRGESGTGKEVFARAIHYLSGRSGRPFVPVNCGAIPEPLVESELFGHRRGAFTGAVKDRIGLIEEADGGTMLLDEVDALPLASQVKLLRFLQDGEFRPLGASKPGRSTVRVIAAGNADFEQIIHARKFREDLFYRINVLRLALPPLRERQGDLRLLAHHFLQKQALLLGCSAKPLAACALECMEVYRWPGNVRELENVLTRALVLSEAAEIQPEDLSLPMLLENSNNDSFRAEKERVVRAFERDYLQKILDRHQGNITHAAQAAAKNRRAFWELLRKHGLSLDRKRFTADNVHSRV
jgi:two-component system response regulator GlrR